MGRSLHILPQSLYIHCLTGCLVVLGVVILLSRPKIVLIKWRMHFGHLIPIKSCRQLQFCVHLPMQFHSSLNLNCTKIFMTAPVPVAQYQRIRSNDPSVHIRLLTRSTVIIRRFAPSTFLHSCCFLCAPETHRATGVATLAFAFPLLKQRPLGYSHGGRKFLPKL